MAESQSQNFNHLKIHTQYSICEGAAKIDDLQDYSKNNKLKSLGLCDTANLCGALEFAEKISKSGTQPIIGTQINFKNGDTTGLLPLFALNDVGYKNIINLSSSSYLKNDELSEPHVEFKDLLQNSDGVAIFSGTVLGLFGKLFDKGSIKNSTTSPLKSLKLLGPMIGRTRYGPLETPPLARVKPISVSFLVIPTLDAKSKVPNEVTVLMVNLPAEFSDFKNSP